MSFNIFSLTGPRYYHVQRFSANSARLLFANAGGFVRFSIHSNAVVFVRVISENPTRVPFRVQTLFVKFKHENMTSAFFSLVGVFRLSAISNRRKQFWKSIAFVLYTSFNVETIKTKTINGDQLCTFVCDFLIIIILFFFHHVTIFNFCILKSNPERWRRSCGNTRFSTTYA